jgi:hypothetical protein
MDDHLRRNLFSAVLYMQSKIKIGKAVINTLQLATRKNYVITMVIIIDYLLKFAITIYSL